MCRHVCKHACTPVSRNVYRHMCRSVYTHASWYGSVQMHERARHNFWPIEALKGLDAERVPGHLSVTAAQANAAGNTLLNSPQAITTQRPEFLKRKTLFSETNGGLVTNWILDPINGLCVWFCGEFLNVMSRSQSRPYFGVPHFDFVLDHASNFWRESRDGRPHVHPFFLAIRT